MGLMLNWVIFYDAYISPTQKPKLQLCGLEKNLKKKKKYKFDLLEAANAMIRNNKGGEIAFVLTRKRKKITDWGSLLDRLKSKTL